MSTLDPLAPDQRAVVSLVLRQGRSYDEIAALLAIPVEAVQARAQAGLAALARDNGLPAEVTAPLADYLLGQQPERDAKATRGLLAESAPARAWAADVAEQLRELAPGGLPEVPEVAATAAGPSRARAEPSREGAARSATDQTTDSSETARATDRATDPSETAAPTDRATDSSETAAPTDTPETASSPPPAPRPRPVRAPSAAPDGDSPPPASRLGGVLLIAGVLAVVAVVLFLVLRGGDDGSDEQVAAGGAPAATATPTPTAAPTQVADRIALRSPDGGNASGRMTVYLQGDRLLFELVAGNVPASGRRSAYAVWFTGPGAKFHRLGFTNPVGADGKLGIQGPSDKDANAFPRLYATYANVVVSRESSESAKRPTKVVLTGKLPKGR